MHAVEQQKGPYVRFRASQFDAAYTARMSLADDILTRAYAVAPEDLDHVAMTLHGVTWQAMVSGLSFQPWDTGGGCMMLLAETPWQTSVGITDGEANLPESEDAFWVGVMNDDNDEMYFLMVQGESIKWRGGELV